MARIIAPLDLMWFVVETPAAPTHVGALLIFDKPANRPRIVHDIVAAYRSHRPTPPFDSVPDLGTGVPRFREAASYDARHHVQHLALPEGSSHDDLLRLVADLHEPMLDRDRPLFRDWFIDGLPDNRFALYAKVHHSIVDGVSGMRNLRSSLQTAPRRSVPRPAFATQRPRPSAAVHEGWGQRFATLGSVAARQALALRDASLLGARKTLGNLLGADPVGSLPFTARRGPMNERVQMGRSLATLSLPLEEMHAVAQRFGATLNDLAVTLIDHGLHRYLREADRPFRHRLVAFCPVSLREDGDHGAGTRVSAIFVHLGSPDSGIVERIGQVTAAMSAAKQEMRALSKDAAMAYGVSLLGIAELETATRVDRIAPPLANLVISNVPGARERLYLAGAPLVGLYPLSAIALSVGLNVTLTSCHDRMDFGFVGNGAAMPGLPSLASGVADAYRELSRAAFAGKLAARGRRGRRRSHA